MTCIVVISKYSVYNLYYTLNIVYTRKDKKNILVENGWLRQFERYECDYINYTFYFCFVDYFLKNK